LGFFINWVPQFPIIWKPNYLRTLGDTVNFRALQCLNEIPSMKTSKTVHRNLRNFPWSSKSIFVEKQSENVKSSYSELEHSLVKCLKQFTRIHQPTTESLQFPPKHESQTNKSQNRPCMHNSPFCNIDTINRLTMQCSSTFFIPPKATYTKEKSSWQ
jgi:hypothetical protein